MSNLNILLSRGLLIKGLSTRDRFGYTLPIIRSMAFQIDLFHLQIRLIKGQITICSSLSEGKLTSKLILRYQDCRLGNTRWQNWQQQYLHTCNHIHYETNKTEIRKALQSSLFITSNLSEKLFNTPYSYVHQFPVKRMTYISVSINAAFYTTVSSIAVHLETTWEVLGFQGF